MAEFKVKATIMPKPGVNDPQGEAIRGGLQSLQFEGLREVRAGKQIVVTVEATSPSLSGTSATQRSGKQIT